MKDTVLKTKDGQEIKLSFLNRSKGFRLGLRAGKEGWGQEGGAWQKNGKTFRVGWWAEQCLRPEAKDMQLPYPEAEVRTAIVEDIKKHGDARLDDDPTGLYFTFLFHPDRDYGYEDIFSPTAMMHFTMESVEWELEQFQGSTCKIALLAFETARRDSKCDSLLTLDYTELAAFVRMVRWAKKEDQEGNNRTLSNICQCIFKMMFAERILRKWFADGRPADGCVKVLE